MADLFDESEILLDFLAEDDSVQEELEEKLAELETKMTSYEMTLLLSEPYDNNNAILEIHPGSGGTEAQDWGDMLLRMYTRFGNAHGFKVEVLDYQAGDEAGIKSVTLSFEGPHAYGLLKSEMGVHRLVRISPFDSANRRHTSLLQWKSCRSWMTRLKLRCETKTSRWTLSVPVVLAGKMSTKFQPVFV